jgi:hypothetical protein
MSNVVLGKPRFVPPKDGKVRDLIFFVAGTTDPTNINGKRYEANKDYWRASVTNFWGKVKELKPQYLDLHIEDSFFSWSGDNNTEERKKGADRMLDLLIRAYPGFKNREAHLHLIGHSHGGNVINAFTELISKDKRFPPLWKVKSITYLSTPFFQKKHQLNHSKLHAACKIINVHNDYDLTQQLIADFSLINLEGLIKSFQIDKFDKGIKMLKSVDSDAITTYLKALYNPFSPDGFKNKAIAARKEMAKAFLGINLITQEFIAFIETLKIKNTDLQKEKSAFITLLNSFLHWTFVVYNNYSNKMVSFDKGVFVNNLNLAQGLGVLNILFDIKSGPQNSYLLSLLAGLFAEKKGISDSIDETSWSPKKQTKGLSILDLSITNKDIYHTRKKKTAFDKFLKGAQGAVQQRQLEDLLMRLFSQFIKPKQMKNVIDGIGLANWVLSGDFKKQLETLKGNFEKYYTFVNKYHAFLVTEKDDTEIKELDKKPGSIPYLAMVSHGLSHTQFWPEVENGLKGAFSSGKNPGYVKK